ncbi:hypothetical protein BC628DRAFT_1348894 [Trametes gibbosa]|nr:hypothetical protein BC628DRAFT_1348894 [Trametes gibbosa]
MDTLPLEILQHIFQLACTDGGFTGCSLSLTSKAVRAAALPFRFHSVFLDASHQQRLRSFMSTYHEQSQLQPRMRLRVKHLYVTLSLDPPPRQTVVSHSDTLEPGPWYLPEDMQAFFRMVSEDVSSLAVQVYPSSGVRTGKQISNDPIPAFNCTFPSLRELTVFGVMDPCALFAPLSDSPLFPHLRRLHIVDTSALFAMYRRGKLRLAPWFAHAPRMSHLRVSNLNSLARGFPDELAVQVGVPLGEESGTAEEEGQATWPNPEDCPPKTHAHLQAIVIQLCSSPPAAAFGGTLCRSYDSFRVRLKRLASYPAYVGLKIAVLEPPKERGLCSFWGRSMRAQWTDGIEGGPGGWEDTEEVHGTVGGGGPEHAVSFVPN